MVSVSFGLEYRVEYFEAMEENPLSYYEGISDSFASAKLEEAGKWDLNNLALYTGLDFDVTGLQDVMNTSLILKIISHGRFFDAKS